MILKWGIKVLKLDEILKLTEKKGIKIDEDSSKKHYILDDEGEKIELQFSDILLSEREQ